MGAGRIRACELAAPAQLNLFASGCGRESDTNQDAGDQDRANQALMERLNNSGDLYLTHTKLDGKVTLRSVRGPNEHAGAACGAGVGAHSGGGGRV